MEEENERKERKERKSIYIAPFRTKVHPKRSGMDHTVLPENNTMPAFPSWAFTRCHHHSNWGSRHPIAALYSFIDPKRMKGWVGLVGWPIADGLPAQVVTHQLQEWRRPCTGQPRFTWKMTVNTVCVLNYVCGERPSASFTPPPFPHHVPIHVAGSVVITCFYHELILYGSELMAAYLN